MDEYAKKAFRIYSPTNGKTRLARSINLVSAASTAVRTIGAQFEIGDAAVAQSCKRFNLKLDKEGRLREKMATV